MKVTQILVAIVVLSSSQVAFGRAMIYKKDRQLGPGYNSGTGRYVDRDRILAIDFDTIAPARANLQSENSNKINEWDVEAQAKVITFALGAKFTYGEYNKDQPSDKGATLDDNESYEILYNRYQLSATRFTNHNKMVGWYVKAGYSYAKIDAQTNLVNNSEGASVAYADVNETRMGPTAAIGHRLSFFKNRTSLNTGISYTRTTKRDVDTDGVEEDRFDSILANAGGKRLDAKDFPEIRIALGVMF